MSNQLMALTKDGFVIPRREEYWFPYGEPVRPRHGDVYVIRVLPERFGRMSREIDVLFTESMDGKFKWLKEINPKEPK